MRRSISIGGELTRSDHEQLGECCGELLAERVRIDRILMQLRAAQGRTIGAVVELYRAVGTPVPTPGIRRRPRR